MRLGVQHLISLRGGSLMLRWVITIVNRMPPCMMGHRLWLAPFTTAHIVGLLKTAGAYICEPQLLQRVGGAKHLRSTCGHLGITGMAGHTQQGVQLRRRHSVPQTSRCKYTSRTHHASTQHVLHAMLLLMHSSHNKKCRTQVCCKHTMRMPGFYKQMAT